MATACLAGAIQHVPAAATPLPADVAVFGQRPATFRDGLTPFPPGAAIFEHQREPDDPVTRLLFRDVPGPVNHLGLFPDRIASFGKYVLLGNSGSTSLGGRAEDFAVGIFDSETKQYCSLVVDPLHPNSVNNLATGNPRARKSRILLAPGSKQVNPADAAFAYILADLDAPSPCTWPTGLATAAQLNAGWPASQQICPNQFCAFDTMALLAHEDVPGDPWGRDFVAVGEYFSGRNAVIRVDAGGIAVVATYGVPLFATPSSGGACYTSGAARRPSADFRLPDGRPTNDWRFLFSYDSFLVQTYTEPPPAHCAPAYPFCPRDVAGDGALGAACPASGSCAQAFCAKGSALVDGYIPCTPGGPAAQCDFFGNDLGPCQATCQLKSSLFRCRNASGGGSLRQCNPLEAEHCPVAGETCSAGVPGITGPSQEYRFDRTTNRITPTSPMFYSDGSGTALVGASPTDPVYDTERAVWVGHGLDHAVYRSRTGSEPCTVDGVTRTVPVGEHCYYDPASPPTAVVVAPDQILGFERTHAIPYVATTAQVGATRYVADTGSLQYAQQYLGAWFPVAASAYKAAFAYGSPYVPITDPLARSMLPAEPRRCSVTLLGCDTNADCLPAGGTCVAVAENGVPLSSAFKFVEAGGAPTSLWVASGYFQAPPVAQTDLFLIRTPVATALTDNLSAVRPAIAWSGERLWLVAEHGGRLTYRIRDDGQWSGWYALGSDNITPVGGPAVIAASAGVRVYARDAAGRVYEKLMTSAAACVPGSCAWSSWSPLPATVTTNDDLAATFAGTQPVVAVRGADDGLYAIVGGAAWGPWFRVGALMLTNAAPAVAYHVPDGRVWITARHKASGVMMYSRINAATRAWDNWAGLSTTGAPTVWGSGPAVVSDGRAVRAYGVDGAYPQWAFQTVNDGSGWSAWRKPLGGSWGTRQPAAANVNGEIELLTYWYVGGMQEAMLP